MRLHEFQEALFPSTDLRDRQRVQQTVRYGVNHHHLFFDRERRVLPLLENFHRARAAIELTLGGGIEVGRERGERFQFAILCKVKSQATGHALHGLDLRRTADA